ncbi:hypothetical protein [Vibrio bathopelagicus]
MTQLTTSTLTTEILKHLEVAHFEAPKPKQKQLAMFEIGLAMKSLRSEFDSDKEFGQSVKSDIIDKCPTKISRRTLNRYQLLADFSKDLSKEDHFALCQKVGFTLVYKLMSEENLKHKEWALENHTKHDSKQLRAEIEKLINPEKYTKQKDREYLEIKAGVSDINISQAMELVQLLIAQHELDISDLTIKEAA